MGNLSFKHAARFKHSISVMMLDIDHFKRINDNFGHSTGDKVLRKISALLNSLVREIDIVARIGGEEFAFILQETDMDEAAIMAERIRLSIEKEVIKENGTQLPITVSLGISSCVVDGETLEHMLTKADDALYIAKKKGRNQIKICP